MVYFVQGATTQMIKIGKATDVRKRLSGLQTGSAECLSVLNVTTARDDHPFHMRFHKYRVHGEWFKPSDELMAYIKSLPPSEYCGLTTFRRGAVAKPSQKLLSPEDIILCDSNLTVNEKLESLLASDALGLDKQNQDDLNLSFFVLDPVEYATKLQTFSIPLGIHVALLKLKVRAPLSISEDVLGSPWSSVAASTAWESLGEARRIFLVVFLATNDAHAAATIAYPKASVATQNSYESLLLRHSRPIKKVISIWSKRNADPTDWSRAIRVFLRNSGSDWPGGVLNMQRMQKKITELGLNTAVNRVGALRTAWKVLKAENAAIGEAWITQ